MKIKKNPYYQGAKSDHFNGLTFFNPNGVKPGNLRDLMKWKFREKREKWPLTHPSPHDDVRPQPKIGDGQIVVTQIGHASQLIQCENLNMVTDPWWSKRASPSPFIGPKRVNPPAIRFANLPQIDVVLLSHNHYDHLDLASLAKLVKHHDPLIVTPLGNDTIIKARIPGAKVTTGDWNDSVDLSQTVRVHFEPCHHWSARSYDDRRMALWAAFVIETPSAKIYHVGDTGYHGGINYHAMAEKYGGFDLSILPIGAYEPRWFMKGQHQNPEEAVLGHIACKSRVSLGHHWATVQLTNEAIEAPEQALAAARTKHGLADHEFIAMRPGQIWDSNNPEA